MVSSSLTTLRATPEKLAALYNLYLEKSSQVRIDSVLSGPQRMVMITALAGKASTQLQNLLTSANDAELSIRKANTPAIAASETSVTRIRWAFDNHLSLTDICTGLIADNDLESFAALRQVLPWAYKARLVDVKQSLAQLQASVDVYAAQIATLAQQAQSRELAELNANMGMLRQSFQTITAFLATQLLPQVVQGTFKRVTSLYRWNGLPGDELPKGSITLACDTPSFVAGSNVEVAPDIAKAFTLYASDVYADVPYK